MKTVIIRRKRIPALSRRHPWIFSGAIKDQGDCEDGDLVEVVSEDGHYCATGYFQHGSIMVRVLSFERVNVDEAFWHGRIQQAKELRASCGLPSMHTNVYRLIHGEGDGLSGLVIDIYGPIAVVQCHTIGMYLMREEIGNALQAVLGDDIQTIYIKSGNALPPRFDVEETDCFLLGAQAEVVVVENECKYQINVVTGQKTGFFIDQRPNRLLLSQFAKGMKVLNLFCYTGGFSVYALRAGASNVTSVDISGTAMQLTDTNVKLNDAADRHQSITTDVMKYLGAISADEYDIIVVDPPAFAKSQKKRHNAIQAYKRLNVAALRKVKSGGLVFTFSCSQVVDAEVFMHTIRAAAIEARRECQVLYHMGQGPDHPVSMFHPEGRYLKGLTVRVI